MTKKLIEVDTDDKYWVTNSEWQNWYHKNKPIEKTIKPIGLNELVYIKQIKMNTDNIPVETLYVCRDNQTVDRKTDADLFTLKIANEFIKNHPKKVSLDGQFITRYEIESLRPY